MIKKNRYYITQLHYTKHNYTTPYTNTLNYIQLHTTSKSSEHFTKINEDQENTFHPSTDIQIKLQDQHFYFYNFIDPYIVTNFSSELLLEKDLTALTFTLPYKPSLLKTITHSSFDGPSSTIHLQTPIFQLIQASGEYIPPTIQLNSTYTSTTPYAFTCTSRTCITHNNSPLTAVLFKCESTTPSQSSNTSTSRFSLNLKKNNNTHYSPFCRDQFNGLRNTTYNKFYNLSTTFTEAFIQGLRLNYLHQPPISFAENILSDFDDFADKLQPVKENLHSIKEPIIPSEDKIINVLYKIKNSKIIQSTTSLQLAIFLHLKPLISRFTISITKQYHKAETKINPPFTELTRIFQIFLIQSSHTTTFQ